MERGWKAKGLLAPLWQERFEGKGRREQLAALTGINAQTLSAYNSGSRQLGRVNAERIAMALGVSLAELGAPEGEADVRGATLRDRLAELRETVSELTAEQAVMNRGLAELVARVQKLEGRRAARAAEAKGPQSRSAR